MGCHDCEVSEARIGLLADAIVRIAKATGAVTGDQPMTGPQVLDLAYQTAEHLESSDG